MTQAGFSNAPHDRPLPHVQWVDQHPQANGFSLIEVSVESPFPATQWPLNLTLAETAWPPVEPSPDPGFQTDSTDQTRVGRLFKQQDQRLFFLSEQPFHTTEVQLQPDRRNPQAWVFLTDLPTELAHDQPVLLTASQPYLATAFYVAAALKTDYDLRVILATETGFPFTVRPARFLFPEFPSQAIGAATLLEDWGLPNRLCHSGGAPGCYDGDLTRLWTDWSLPDDWSYLNLDRLLSGRKSTDRL